MGIGASKGVRHSHLASLSKTKGHLMSESSEILRELQHLALLGDKQAQSALSLAMAKAQKGPRVPAQYFLLSNWTIEGEINFPKIEERTQEAETLIKSRRS